MAERILVPETRLDVRNAVIDPNLRDQERFSFRMWSVVPSMVVGLAAGAIFRLMPDINIDASVVLSIFTFGLGAGASGFFYDKVFNHDANKFKNLILENNKLSRENRRGNNNDSQREIVNNNNRIQDLLINWTAISPLSRSLVHKPEDRRIGSNATSVRRNENSSGISQNRRSHESGRPTSEKNKGHRVGKRTGRRLFN